LETVSGVSPAAKSALAPPHSVFATGLSKTLMLGEKHMETDIQSNVTTFHQRLQLDANHRYRSWEHCHSYFRQRTAVNEDTACLQLAFYLASWGMYRGSSFLLWKDYLIHKEIVRGILDPKYDALWNVDYGGIQRSGTELSLLFDLIKWIRDWYVSNVTSVNGTKRKVNVSDTLVTKILLGTIGCIPAYDRFLILGMRHKGLSFSSLNTKNYWQLIEFYRENKNDFDAARTEISSASSYPIMKIVDMYFWNIGFTLLPDDNEE